MEGSFEQNIPISAIITGFIALTLLNFYLRRWLRNRKHIREGQLPYDAKRVPTIEERVKGNSAWAKGEIKAMGGIFVIILWTCALAWNLTFGASFIASFSNASSSTAQKVILGFFSLGGFVFIYFAIQFTIRHFRFGKSWCLIEGKAGVLGKEMKGKIKTSKDIQATGEYKFTLQCIDTYYTGSGKNRSTKSNIEFQTISTAPSAGVRSKSGIPFSFILPSYPPETGYQLARGTISWQLKVEAPVKGVDYLAMFIIPVFKQENI